MSKIQDAAFLKTLDGERNKFYYARIIVLDKLDRPIKSIEGRVLDGSSISINGSSSVRRTCTISVLAQEADNDLTNIENFLSINKKIKIAVGIEKWIDYSQDIYYYEDKEDTVWDNNNPFAHGFPAIGQIGKIYVDRSTMTYWKWVGRSYQQIGSIYEYDKDLVWFPLGVFVINQPSLSHTTDGCVISLSCKDKMCLLNGEMGGGLPTSVTFHEYNQVIGELVCSRDPRTDSELTPNNYTVYKYGEQYYTWTREYGWKESDNSTVGETISVPQLIYDIIYTAVVNYGGESPSRVIINDIPREIKQLVRYVGNAPLYHNTSTGQYTTDELYLTQEGTWQEYGYNEDVGYTYTDFTYPGQLITNIGDNVGSVLEKIKTTLGNYEYFYDIDGNFVFQEIKNYLNTSYVPTEIQNETQTFYLDNSRDYDIDTNSLRIIGTDNYRIDLCADQKSIYTFEEGNGLITSYSNSPNFMNLKNDYHIWGKNADGLAIHYHLVIKDQPTEMQTRQVVFLKDEDSGQYTGKIRLAREGENGVDYTPNDWRAELYLQGLEVAKGGGRPDIYQQELLDLFDNIYEWGYYKSDGTFIFEGRFKADITHKPNSLTYFLDYLEPTDRLYGIAVDDINPKIYSYQQDKITRLYNNTVPNYIIIDQDMSDDYKYSIAEKCDESGQPHSIVEPEIYAKLAIGTAGYSAQETIRDFLYQYTTYNESISIQCVPIYYLDVNRRITVKDRKAGISGDYVINSITLPLSPSGNMSISASRALDRI